MLTAGDEGWDGPRNLLDTATVAASPASAGRGAMVVFHGEVLAGRAAVKTHATALAAFSSPHGGAIGRVAEGTVEYVAGAQEPAWGAGARPDQSLRGPAGARICIISQGGVRLRVRPRRAWEIASGAAPPRND